MRKALIVSYYWPPAGGPGVQRVLKFSKYMPDLGWQPIILTVKRGAYPALDKSLEEEVHSSTLVYRTANLEPDQLYKSFTGLKQDDRLPVGLLAAEKKNWKNRLANAIRLNVFIPDAKLLWQPAAVKAGRDIIETHKPDVIFSSSPPPTTHLIARRLARIGKIPWVADFRDPWTQIHYYRGKRWSQASRLDAMLEKRVTDDCDLLTCVSRAFAELLPVDDKQKIRILPNGFDAADFQDSMQRPERFRIIYIGGLNPNRFYPEFFESIARLISSDKMPADRVKIIFAGQVTLEIKEKISDIFKDAPVVKFSGYVNHDEAVRLMQSAALQLLFMEKVEKYEGHLPGKLFEYLAAGNPVLGVGSKSGEAARILEKTKSGSIITADDDPAPLILKEFEAWQKQERRSLNKKEIARYSRENLTKQLVEIFNGLLA